jgi:hypothetical protein
MIAFLQLTDGASGPNPPEVHPGFSFFETAFGFACAALSIFPLRPVDALPRSAASPPCKQGLQVLSRCSLRLPFDKERSLGSSKLSGRFSGGRRLDCIGRRPAHRQASVARYNFQKKRRPWTCRGGFAFCRTASTDSGVAKACPCISIPASAQ